MIRRPPRSTRTDTLFPYATLVRSGGLGAHHDDGLEFAFDLSGLAPDEKFANIKFRHVAPFLHNRSEEHTSELQSLMRISYAVFCLKKTTVKWQSYKP